MIRSTTSPWTGMVPVDDTALSVTDTRGPGHPVVVELAERSAEVIGWESDDPVLPNWPPTWPSITSPTPHSSGS